MILCFSGTGNSRYIAKKIAVELQDEIVDVNAKIKAVDYSPIKTGENIAVASVERSKFNGVLRNIIGMIECVMILRVDCCCQCINRCFIFMINLHIRSIFLGVGILNPDIKYLDRILSVMLYMIYSHIGIVYKVCRRGCAKRCYADTNTYCECFHLIIGSVQIHFCDLLASIFRQVLSGEHIISRQDNCKFFSAISRDNAVVTDSCFDNLGNVPKCDITLGSSVQLVI